MDESKSSSRYQNESDKTLAQDMSQADAARDLSQRQLQPPAEVPGYEILSCLGEGAYGTVWLARENSTGKRVAIKFYSHRRGLDWSLLSREVEKLAVLYTSRNVVSLLDVGWDGQPPYFIMEYLENGSLADRLSEGPLPVSETLPMAKSIAKALLHAHGSGILHCDLKPANVLLDSNNEPRLSDFGQSRLSDEQNPALGTLFYMAPEQADLKAVPDARWDVYALGSLLYHMLTGEPPYFSPNRRAELSSHETLEEKLNAYQKLIADSPIPSEHRKIKGVDRNLANIIDRCLSKDPKQRFANVQVVLNRLQIRDRNRTRRPLIALGILAPAILLLALIPVANTAIQSAVRESELNLTKRALDGDVISARLLATNINRELEDRRSELVEYSENPKLREAILQDQDKDWEDRNTLREFLDSIKKSIDQRQQEIYRPTDTSWFLANSNGKQIYRHPISDTIEKVFTHRDYFHGLGFEYEKFEVPEDIQPIQKPYISQSFKSDATGQFMVSITVPIWDEERSKVIGVLGRTTHLWELLKEWEQSIQGRGGDRIIGLIDLRDGHVLSHPWMTQQNLKELSPAELDLLKLSSDQQKMLKKMILASSKQEAISAERTAKYIDPIHKLDPTTTDDEWLAAFALVGNTEWVTIVQEKKRTALSPVEQVKVVLIRYGLMGLAVAFAVMVGFWIFLPRLFGYLETGNQNQISTNIQ